MVPKVGASPREVDRALGHPHIQARREGAACLISWSLPEGPPATFPDTWEWCVERCGSPGGPFTRIATWLDSSETSWRDDTLPRGRENTRKPYYRIVFRSEGEETTYGYRPEWDTIVPGGELHGFTWEEAGLRSAYVPGIVRETRRRFSILVRNHARRLVAVYREAWLEGPCDQCVDGRTGERISPTGGGGCPACFGTGRYGGYYTPLRAEIGKQSAETLRPQEIPQGTHDLVEQKQYIAPWWPLIEPRDILRFGSGELVLVDGVSYPDGYEYPVLTIMDVSQLPRTHILNTLPMPELVNNASAGPRRQHGRAMNLDAYRDSLSGGAMARAGATLPTEPANPTDPEA